MNDNFQCKKLFQRIEELEKEYIDFWVDICNIESPTEYKEGVDRVGAFIMEKALKSGGTADNTVPEKCTFTADIRFNNKSEMLKAERIVNEVAARSYVDGSSCIVTLKSRRIAMELNERNTELLDKLNRIYEQNKLPTLEMQLRLIAFPKNIITTAFEILRETCPLPS